MLLKIYFKLFFIGILLLVPSILLAQAVKDCSSCSLKLIEYSQIENLEIYNLRLLKNEIYARKGFVFSNNEFKKHFEKQTWYKPKNNNKSIQLSEIETKNVEVISQRISEISQFISVEENSKYRTLTQDKINEIFTENKKTQLGIEFDIWKVYDYKDKTGNYYLVLTENKSNINQESRVNLSIKAFNFKIENQTWKKTFETNDFKENHENSIWFWTRYIYSEDFDNDGIIEPIIIYGTSGSNNYDDGRIKILIYHKGKKVGIRIQNGILDDERNLRIDKEFYLLPKTIQDKVLEQMNAMVDNNHSILPYGWQEKMKKKKLFIEE